MPRTEKASLLLWYLQNWRLCLRLQIDDYYKPFLDVCAKEHCTESHFQGNLPGKVEYILSPWKSLGLFPARKEGNFPEDCAGKDHVELDTAQLKSCKTQRWPWDNPTMVSLHHQREELESSRRCISDSVHEGNHPERRCHRSTDCGSGLMEEQRGSWTFLPDSDAMWPDASGFYYHDLFYLMDYLKGQTLSLNDPSSLMLFSLQQKEK